MSVCPLLFLNINNIFARCRGYYLKETAVSSQMLPPKRNGASRLLPCLHYLVMQIQMFWNSQRFGNSRGQRMVDPVIMYQDDYGSPIKAQIVNLHDKQIVFPEDDDSDIIIVNENFNGNTIDEGRIESLKEGISDLVETTTESTENRIPPSDVNDYVWMTTEWSMCSAHCGQTGHQIRGAVCRHKISNQTSIVETDECVSRGLPAPTVLRDCASNSCATWRTSAWSTPRCLPSGNAIVRRRVECVSENGTVVSDALCVYSRQPDKTRKEAQPCKPVWAVGPWSKCKGPCGDGRQHRVLRCVWRAGRRATRRRERPAAVCAHKRPNVVRECRQSTCTKDGVCRDSSRYCENVRAMNMCALRRYKEQCCKTCED